MKSHTLSVTTAQRTEFVNVTARVQDWLKKSGAGDGLCCLFVPHTTAAITINEGADPDVARDILEGLAALAPAGARYHHAEGNADAHIKASLVGSSEVIAVSGGRLLLGTWQAVFFCEFDGPRSRKLNVSFVESAT